MIIGVTGSYQYDSESVANSLKNYQQNHAIYHDAYKDQVKVSLITAKISSANNIYPPVENVKGISTEGIYYVEFLTYFKYIKFLDDSSVITISTNIPPEKALKLINENLEGMPKGDYTVAGTNISFTTIQEKSEGKVARVEYKGYVKKGKLYLSSYSQSTKNNRFLIYKYYKK